MSNTEITYISKIMNKIKSINDDIKELNILYENTKYKVKELIQSQSDKKNKLNLVKVLLADSIIKIDVGGTVFYSNVNEILAVENTLFTEIFLNKYYYPLSKIIFNCEEDKSNYTSNQGMITYDLDSYIDNYNNNDKESNLKILNFIKECEKNENTLSKYQDKLNDYAEIELFIDRNPKFFDLVLEYLNNNNINTSNLSNTECNLLRKDAEFYEIDSLVNLLKMNSYELQKIKIVSFKVVGGSSHPKNSISEISNQNNSVTGVSVNLGSIIFKLDKKYAISGFNIKGMNNPNLNGSQGFGSHVYINSKLYVSLVKGNCGVYKTNIRLDTYNGGQRIVTDEVEFKASGNLGISYLEFY